MKNRLEESPFESYCGATYSNSILPIIQPKYCDYPLISPANLLRLLDICTPNSTILPVDAEILASKKAVLEEVKRDFSVEYSKYEIVLDTGELSSMVYEFYNMTGKRLLDLTYDLLKEWENGHDHNEKLIQLLNEAERSCYAKRNDTISNKIKEILSIVLKNGGNVNQSDNDGCTLLFVAAKYGHTNIVYMLLENMANVNQSNNDGCTPLFVAAKYGHTNIVYMLLENMANVNQPDNSGDTPLIVAIIEGHENIVDMLIKAGADFNVINNNRGLSPLKVAHNCGNIRIVDMLKRAYLERATSCMLIFSNIQQEEQLQSLNTRMLPDDLKKITMAYFLR